MNYLPLAFVIFMTAPIGIWIGLDLFVISGPSTDFSLAEIVKLASLAAIGLLHAGLVAQWVRRRIETDQAAQRAGRGPTGGHSESS